MSRFLLDTHAFLWFVFDDPRLSDHAEEIILDPDIEKVLSIGSLWEIVIKSQLDKLRLGMTIEDFFRSHVVDRVLTLLPIELDHLVEYSELPLHHRDPFDRLLVAQARSLGIPVVTSDTKLSAYEVETLW
jgi:PIN domain nuclease of toxin-antitoxin system